MSSQQPYEVGTSIASIFIDEETEAQKDEGTCPKLQIVGEAGLWNQEVELLARRTEMGSYRSHILCWVSDNPWGPLLPSGEVTAERQWWWFLRILKGKPAVGPKQQCVGEMKRYGKGLNYVPSYPPQIAKDLGKSLRVSGCRLVAANADSIVRWNPKLEWVPGEVPREGGRNDPSLMASLVCQLWTETPVSHLMTLPFQMGKLRLREDTWLIQDHTGSMEKSPSTPIRGPSNILSRGKSIYCLVGISGNTLGIYKLALTDQRWTQWWRTGPHLALFSLNIIFKFSPDEWIHTDVPRVFF